MQKYFSLKYLFLNKVQKHPLSRRINIKMHVLFLQASKSKHINIHLLRPRVARSLLDMACGISLREQRESTTVGLRFLSQNLNLVLILGWLKRAN